MTDIPEEPDEPFESESSFIRFLTQQCLNLDMQSDFSDDCAYLKQHTELLTTDTIIAGVHFDHRYITPEQIGRQAAVVSLSDLAASGAGPSWVMLSLQLPTGWFGNRLRSLCDGFLSVLSLHQASLVGGNCARTTGPLSVTVTVGGQLFGRRPITRSHAQPGDRLCVSGTLGRAAIAVVNTCSTYAEIRHSWRPHFAESRALVIANIPTAMMDISDGLVIDAARLAHASGVDVHIETDKVPCLPPSKAFTRTESIDFALYGGEDYVLLFTCPPHVQLPTWAHVVGSIETGTGMVYVDGQPQQDRGFDHFEAHEEHSS